MVCINFRPVGKDTLRQQFKLILDTDWPEEVWQDYQAPIIRRSATAGIPEAALATFGMIPQSQLQAGKRFTTMNARIETVAELRSFSSAWKNFQFCLVPMTGFYEPRYEMGKSTRWKINHANNEPFCVAGLWREWPNRIDNTPLSFTMLTTNVDNHGYLKQFHKPEDEKRSLIIIPPEKYNAWLECEAHEEIGNLLQVMPEEWYGGEPHPIPKRATELKK